MQHTEYRVYKTTYNLLADAQQFMKEPSEHDLKAQIFALHVNAYHHTFARERQYTPTQHANIAPPFMSREIFELIMTLIDSRTVSELLKDRQKVMTVKSVRDFTLDESATVTFGLVTFGVLKKAFPDISSHKKGYRRVYNHNRSDWLGWDDVICLNFEKWCENLACEDRLKWSVSVDLKQIYITQDTENLAIPDSAITVQTNVNEVKTKLKISDALVTEMLGLRLHGVMSNDGHRITLCNETGIGFVLKIHIKNANGRHVKSHKGIAVGDTVRIVKTYKPYDFAVNRQGVVRMIIGLAQMMFIVEMGETTSAISKRIVEVNEKRKYVKDQPAHCLACQISHVQKI
jgi:hypothetical protein